MLRAQPLVGQMALDKDDQLSFHASVEFAECFIKASLFTKYSFALGY